MTHAEIMELLGAYSLDAVSPEEAAEIEEHLAECPRCRAEVAAHREVAGVLGNLGGTAPAGLWSRIADELAIGSEGYLAEPAHESPFLGRPTFGLRAADAPVLAADPTAETGQAPAPVISIGSARLSEGGRSTARSAAGGSSRRRTILFSSVAALAAALAIVAGVLSSKVSNLNHQVSALSAAVLDGGVKAQVAAAKLQPDHSTINLTSTDSSDHWSAQVVAVPDGRAFLVPGKMPVIPIDKTFQAWALVGDRYVSLGVLGRAPGDVAMQLQPGMSAVLVDIEPVGGSPQPTAAPLVRGALPKSL